MPTTIPLTPNARYQINVDVEDQTIELTIGWNSIEEAWYADIKGVTFNLLLRRRKLVGGVNILKPHAVLELGGLFVLDAEAENLDPDFNLIGDRYLLIYVSKDEMSDFTI